MTKKETSIIKEVQEAKVATGKKIPIAKEVEEVEVEAVAAEETSSKRNRNRQCRQKRRKLHPESLQTSMGKK